MDAVVDLGAAGFVTQPRRADGMPVHERHVEGVEKSQPPQNELQRANIYTNDEAVLTLVVGSKDQFDMLLAQFAKRRDLAENPAPQSWQPGSLDTYA